jgi:hypothetical protein
MRVEIALFHPQASCRQDVQLLGQQRLQDSAAIKQFRLGSWEIKIPEVRRHARLREPEPDWSTSVSAVYGW